MARQAGPVISFFMGVIFIVAGGGIGFYIGKPVLDRAKASESWPTADGTIVQSSLDQRRKKKSTTYTPSVAYRYQVAGESFEGNEIWFGQYSSSNRSAMQKLVDEYPVGKEIPVYYSPDHPATAVLKPGAFTSSYMVFGIGMLFFAVGCLMAIIPLARLVLVTTIFATSPESSFAGGATRDDRFSSGSIDRHNRDDDGFEGIPGN